MTHIIGSSQIGSETESVSGTHDIDFGSYKLFASQLTVTGDVTIDIINFDINDRLMLDIAQDGTGGHIVTFSSKFKWEGGIVPTLTTTANAKDTFSLLCGDSSINANSVSLDVK